MNEKIEEVTIEVEEDKDQTVRIQPSWTNEPTFDDLYKDYKAAQSDQSIYLAELEVYKTNYDGGVLPSIPKGKSRAQPKLIRKQAEWEYPQIEEPFLNTKDMFDVEPRTAEDKPGARQNEDLINYQWEVKINKVDLVGDIVKTIVDEGTVIVKTGWESDEDVVMVDKEVPIYASAEESMAILEQAVASGKMTQDQAQQILMAGKPVPVGSEIIQVEEEKLVKNQPSYEVCDNRNIVLDPTAKRTENLQFIIHEYDTDMSTLQQEEYKVSIEVDPETGKEIKEEYGIYHNLNKINVNSGDYNTYDESLYNDDDKTTTSFEFQDAPRKKLRAYEYWGYWDIDGDGETECIVATWIDNVMIRMEKTPFPFKDLPFSIGKYMLVKNEVTGQPPGALLIENQNSIGKMTRAAHDITSDQAVGQNFIDEEFFAGPSQRDNYKSGKTVYFRHGMDPKVSIHKQSIDSVPPVVFQMIDYQTGDAESMSGTKVFGQGINSQALGSVATGIRSSLDAAAKRKLSLLRRVSQDIFVDLAKKTIMMNQVFLSEEEVIRVTNSEYVPIRREDIAGEYDVTVDVSTPEKDNETAEKLNMMMQTNAASMDPELAKIIYAEMAHLWKKPALEKKILEYQPQPDPAAEEMKRTQLENAQLENQKLKMEIEKLAKDIESENSKITERQSRTAQNLDSESEENMANARYKNAQAQNLESVSDLNNQKFVRIQDGTARAETKEDNEFGHTSKQEQQALKQQMENQKSEQNREAVVQERDTKRAYDAEAEYEKQVYSSQAEQEKQAYDAQQKDADRMHEFNMSSFSNKQGE